MEDGKQERRLAVGLSLPDFRNLGAIFRIVLVVNLLGALTVMVRADGIWQLLPEFLMMAARIELPLFLAVLSLYALGQRLRQLPRRTALTAIFSLVILIVFLTSFLLSLEGSDLLRSLSWGIAATIVTLVYFDYRAHTLSSALTEARLMALTARIRPHFLFNSLNCVLGFIRTDPRRAERGLEELADLFRVLMRDNRELVPLSEEITLCERYLELEQLRLGDRLTVRWDLQPSLGALTAARVPPLMLQPLIENAVYHGVELMGEMSEIFVGIARHGNELRLEVDNPCPSRRVAQGGNRMALDNIRERLMLFYDLEARLDIDRGQGRFRVRIRLPFRESPT